MGIPVSQDLSRYASKKAWENFGLLRTITVESAFAGDFIGNRIGIPWQDRFYFGMEGFIPS